MSIFPIQVLANRDKKKCYDHKKKQKTAKILKNVTEILKSHVSIKRSTAEPCVHTKHTSFFVKEMLISIDS